MWVLYGIKNCDKIKKTQSWLDTHQVSYRFHDYRVDGLNAVLLQNFIDKLGLANILNQRSSSWRQLSDAQKNDLTEDLAIELMLSIPTLIKRPILDTGKDLIVGLEPNKILSLL